MKCLFLVFSLITIIFFHDASAQDGRQFSVKKQTNKGVDDQIEKALPLVIKACPGLDKYGDDLSPASVQSFPFYDTNFDGGIVLEFVVTEHPKKLPRPLNLYSGGHHCFVYVSKSGEKMYIGKRACHSLCTGIWTENDPGSMGREFDLVP